MIGDQIRKQSKIINDWSNECAVAYKMKPEDVEYSHIVAFLAQKELGLHTKSKKYCSSIINGERESIRLISEERQRQIEKEGYTPEHDAEHWNQSLVRAASCYALGTRKLERQFGNDQNRVTLDFDLWPWNDTFWKPTPDNRVKELTKAGALIAAEIDRLLNNENS